MNGDHSKGEGGRRSGSMRRKDRSNYEDSSSTVKDMWLELYESEVHNRNV